ncbi:VWD domain-containing protein [Dyadobacter arcticus]|uniref:VWFD domain-containing protein n=1 Tax=Dyadobacter arcticus TaxID=1078754 RepID=A0ABX0UHB2_9BACT|nr:VWD domain-containing protein [Dyadobacter arcticus]NIJ52302.1 hypothetical protein [Dyadobacter arcticus]
MKSQFKKFIWRAMAAGFLVTVSGSCKREIIEELSELTPRGEVNGVVILPAGTSWAADELGIVSIDAKENVRNSAFRLSQFDLSGYNTIYAVHPDGKLAMAASMVGGQTQVEMSATSTAVTLLMISPVAMMLTDSARVKLIDFYKIQPEFPALVKSIEELVKKRTDISDESNSELFRLINQIHRTPVKIGNRETGTTDFLQNEERIDLSLEQPRAIKVTNLGSALYYQVEIYDQQKGENVASFTLPAATLGNTSVVDAAVYFAEDPDRMEACYEDAKRRIRGGLAENKLCDGPGQFFSLKMPEPNFYVFKQNGDYTVKISNGFRLDGRSEIDELALEENSEDLVIQLISVLVKASVVKNTYDKIGPKCKKALGKELKSFFKIEAKSMKDNPSYSNDQLSFKLVQFTNNTLKGLNDCVLEAGIVSYGGYTTGLLKTFFKLVDVASKIGSVWNIMIKLNSIASDKPYYEFCIRVDPKNVLYCTDSPNTADTYYGGKSFGDPNIITFDGKSYGFNGVGEFMAAKSLTDNFEIQVRQEELVDRNNSGSVSWNTGLAIHTGADKLCFYPGKYYVNQDVYRYPSILDVPLQNGGSIQGDQQTIVISTGNGDLIKVFNHGDAFDYSIIPDAKRKAKMTGIFGNYDNRQDNDLQIRNGAQISGSYNTLYPEFADSYRIPQNQSLFVYDAGKNTESYTDRKFPRSALEISNVQRARAEQACKSAGVVAPFLEGCINDVVATGDNKYADRSKDLQDERVLKAFNINLGNPDRSLYNWSENVGFVEDYALLEGGYGSSKLLTKNNVPITSGFEMTLHMSATKEQYLNSIIISPIESKLPIFYRIADTSFPSVDLFDNRKHKIDFIFVPVLNGIKNEYRMTIVIDGKIVLNETAVYTDLLTVDRLVIENEGKAKIYNWAYKSR